MPAYNFRPITEPDLPDVAAFLYQQQDITSREDPTQATPSNDDLRWLLTNPHRREDLPLGDTLRDAEGRIFGMIVHVPRVYRLDSRRLLGACGGHWFVDSSARMQGFFMLRRFFSASGYDFIFANSANRQSGPIWVKCGAQMVPESEVEYLFPIRLGPLVEELAIRKKWHPAVARLVRTAGPLATLFGRPRLPKNRLRLDPCKDLDRLAEIAERDRDPAFLQPERSVPYLKWVYGSWVDAPGSGETGDVAVYRFATPAGHEGWFSIGYSLRGGRKQIRAARLNDVVWPVEHMPFTDVIPAIVEVVKPRSDLLSIRGRVGTGLKDRVLGLRKRALLAPEGFLIGRNPSTADLINVADFPFADRY